MREYGAVTDEQVRAAGLLAGPRGRELCAGLAGVSAYDIRDLGAARLAAILASRDDGGLAEGFDSGSPLAALPVLNEIANHVSYWGDYTADDPLEDTPVFAALQPVAELAAAAAGSQWWWSGLDRDGQGYVQWTQRTRYDARADPLPGPGRTGPMLYEAARADAEREQQMAEYRRFPAGAGPGSQWWSCPRAFETTRCLDGLGAVILAVCEDGFGDTEALVWPVAISDEARVYEVDGPAAWQQLVTAYPRVATASYRHTWYWTGWDGDWLVPDWPAVARDWDGVHLTVAAYLETAGRTLRVGSARTMLAGWNPDETYWFADVLVPAGEPQHWRTDDGSPLTWHQY